MYTTLHPNWGVLVPYCSYGGFVWFNLFAVNLFNLILGHFDQVDHWDKLVGHKVGTRPPREKFFYHFPCALVVPRWLGKSVIPTPCPPLGVHLGESTQWQVLGLGQLS